MIFEDIHESEEITLKNIKGKEFKVSPVFRTLDDNIFIQKLASNELPEYKDYTIHERNKVLMQKLCGMTIEFWGQFSNELLTKLNDYLLEKEKEKGRASEEDKKKQ